MDLDELPSAGLTDAHYEHLELFPEVAAQAENAAIDALAFEAELASSVTAASPATFSAATSQIGDDIASVAGSDCRPASVKKTPAKKKGAALKKTASLASGGSAKRAKTTSAPATAKTAVRKPKTKPAGAVNGISPGNIGRESSSASGSGRDPAGDSDDPGTYCLCLGRDDHRWMICCEKCEDWFHGECIDLDKETGESLIEMFICPRCTTAAAEQGEELVTRYKKMCALDGCRRPARSYVKTPSPMEDEDAEHVQISDGERTSVFCSAEHCHTWWERIAARLPPASTIPPSVIGRLSREDLLGVLSAGLGTVDPATGTYVLVPRSFSSAVSGEDGPDAYLSEEEKTLLAQSEYDRQAMEDEIDLCKKMHILLERVNERHKAAVAAGYIASDICGYDVRLDAVGVQAAFAEFVASAEGVDAFSGEELNAPLSERLKNGAAEASDDELRRLALAGMCDKKRCKAHQGWMAMFHRATKAQMKQLAEQAQNKKNDEDLVRRAALERFRRKTAERNWVEVPRVMRTGNEENDMDLD